MFWICSRPAPPELMPGSIVFTIFAASGSRSVVFFAAPDGLGVPELDGVQAATASTTSRDSAISFLMTLLLAGKTRPQRREGYAWEKAWPADRRAPASRASTSTRSSEFSHETVDAPKALLSRLSAG